MEYRIDDELRKICSEIAQEGKSEQEWAHIKASDWFQTSHYNGGFDAIDMQSAFTEYIGESQYCFGINLNKAPAIARNERNTLSLRPESDWRNTKPTTETNRCSD